MHVKLSSSDKEKGETDMDEDNSDGPESWNVVSYFTSANYQGKKTVFLLFINRR